MLLLGSTWATHIVHHKTQETPAYLPFPQEPKAQLDSVALRERLGVFRWGGPPKTGCFPEASALWTPCLSPVSRLGSSQVRSRNLGNDLTSDKVGGRCQPSSNGSWKKGLVPKINCFQKIGSFPGRKNTLREAEPPDESLQDVFLMAGFFSVFLGKLLHLRTRKPTDMSDMNIRSQPTVSCPAVLGFCVYCFLFFQTAES